MISDKHKYIFIHIPKCAGSSIEKLLMCNEGVTCDWTAKFPLKTLSDNDKHKYKLDIDSQQHAQIGTHPIEKQRNYFCFTVVRNPWAKLISSWLYHKRLKNYPGNLKQFITSNDIGYDRHDQVEPYHLDTQTSFINEHVNVICRFESFVNDFQYIQNKLKIDGILPHENKSITNHYSEYYDDETRQIVAEIYASDIKSFNYNFDNV
jgi:chondroitin 4-sulfotransferase 11